MAILHVAYSKAKRHILGRNLKVPKSQKKDSENTLKLFYAASGSKKRLIFDKRQDFEKWQKWPYSMWAILRQKVHSGKEFKSAKITEEGLKKHIEIILCSKRLEKTPNIRRMTRF